MSQKNIYRVGILAAKPSSYIDINNKVRGLMPSIWYYISKKLSKKYIFKEIIINENIDWAEYLDKVSKKEYDIIIAGYWIIPDRLKNGTFTKGILLNAPRIVYQNDIQDKIIPKKYIKYIFKIWYKPILLLITICLFLCVFYYLYRSWRFEKSSLILFFGVIVNKNNLDTRKMSNIERIIILITIYFLTLFIVSYTLQYTVSTQDNFRLIDNDITGMTFYVQNGSYSVELLKKYGAIPLEVKEPYIEYNRNRFNKNINGYIFDDIDIDGVLLHKDKEFSISNIFKQWYYVGFPINNENKELIADINNLIEEMKVKGKIYEQCQNIVGNSSVIFC